MNKVFYLLKNNYHHSNRNPNKKGKIYTIIFHHVRIKPHTLSEVDNVLIYCNSYKSQKLRAFPLWKDSLLTETSFLIFYSFLISSEQHSTCPDCMWQHMGGW